MPKSTLTFKPSAITRLARSGPTQKLQSQIVAASPTSRFEPIVREVTIDDPGPDYLDPDDLTPTIEPLTRIWALRGADLFNGVFHFHNMSRHPLLGKAQRASPDLPAILTLELPGQHFGEEATISNNFDAPLRSRLAGRSRLAVKMPHGSSGVELRLDALLTALTEWPLNLDPLASATAGGLNKSMLRAVSDSFGGLRVQLYIHMLDMGLISLPMQADRIARSLAGEAHRVLSDTHLATAGAAAANIRTVVEAASGAYADQARAAISGSATRKREAAETAEALVEVGFAKRFADLVLANDDDYGIELLVMSGLFNLMMHPHPPSDEVTALELPYRLFTSPRGFTQFTHSVTPASTAASGGERVEMWRTRLGRRQGIDPPEGHDFVAMWTPDYDLEENLMTDQNGAEVTMSVPANVRRWIVKRTTGFNEEPVEGQEEEDTNGNPIPHYRPKAAKVRKLELSPLGASLDLGVTWPNQADAFPDFGGLTGWQHRIGLGRDDRVRFTEAGILYPFGVLATKVTLTERQFRPSGGVRWAPLRLRQFYIVDDSPLFFPRDGQPNAGRGMPFRSLRCTTERTPRVDPDQPVASGQDAQKILFQGQPYLFEFIATDDQGREIGFRMPQFFLPANYKESWETNRSVVSDAWIDGGPRYTANLHGQMMRMARGASRNLDMGVEEMTFIDADGPPGDFAPAMNWAKAHIPGVAEISGKADAGPRKVSLTPNHLDANWPGDGHRVVLSIDTPIDLDFSGDLTSDAMGAIGQATQRIGAISDALGPVPLAGANLLNKAIRGDTDWDDVLPQFKVLGKFLLKQLLSALTQHNARLPTFKVRRTTEEVIREWKLQEQISNSVNVAGVVLSPRGAASQIFLHAFVKATLHRLEVEAGPGGGPTSTADIPTGVSNPTAEAHGRITNIDLTLFEIMKVRFNEIGFDAVAGKKPDARVVMNADPMEFYGPLEFLNGLKDLIPTDGLGHGPMINPLPTGVDARFDIGLPNLVLGAFSLKNMTLGAQTIIPFQDRPVELTFNFNERQRPFELAVAGIGGGGFFMMTVDTGGVKEIEAALEFGASVSMSIGVASGSVSIKGGVYFRHADALMIFEGYVELRGRLSVLKLITVSLVFNLALAYEKRGDRKLVRGEASLRVEVEVLFFSTSVTLRVERSFDTGDADPLFIDMHSRNDWLAHCNAFA